MERRDSPAVQAAVRRAQQARRDHAKRRRIRAMVDKLREAGWVVLPPKIGGGNYEPGDVIPLDQEDDLFATLLED